MTRTNTTYEYVGSDVVAHISRDDIDGTFTGEGRVPRNRWTSNGAARSAALLKASIDLLENRLAAHTIEHMDAVEPDPYKDARDEQHPLDDEGVCLNIMCRREMEMEWETELADAEEKDIDTRCADGCCLTDEGGEDHEPGESLDWIGGWARAAQEEESPFTSVEGALRWLAHQPGVRVERTSLTEESR